MSFHLIRDDQNDTRTFGALFDGDERLAETLELPWRGNQHNVSCIPAGTYTAKLQWSPVHNRFVYWITGVPGRDAVEIHVGNFVKDTHGCVLLGTIRVGDTIGASKVAFEKFMNHMHGVDSFSLTITDPIA